ncbi:MAG: phosphatidylserine decarboxylase family protein [Prosthecochloris sp.]|nr:phosphatidylserine decarboxylase family protein [Prosthecochloris sp.]
MLSPYGKGTLVTSLLISLLLAGAGLIFPGIVQAVFSTASVGLALFALFFFRDPSRTVPSEPNAVLAPADGRVLLIKKIAHPFTGQNSTLVSIFMSPFNVHVNRIPLQGRIAHLSYSPGKHLMAFNHASMADNERMEIGLENSHCRIIFSQVAGFIARRIVCSLRVGDNVAAGSRFGMITFGSRLDIVVPESTRLTVSKGCKTVAGETVIGYVK